MQGKKNRITTSTYALTLNDIAEGFKENCNPEFNIEDLNDIFKDDLLCSIEQMKETWKQTTEKSHSNECKSQRKGTLTASQFSELNRCSKRLKEQKIDEYSMQLLWDIHGFIKHGRQSIEQIPEFMWKQSIRLYSRRNIWNL